MKLSHHRHTGRLQPHHHTSYAGLLFATLLGVVVLLAATFTTYASHTPETGPQSGSIGLQGTVDGPPPDQAARIDVPFNGQRFSSIPVEVSGFCQEGLIVKIFRNGFFAGSTVCDSDDRFVLFVDLFDGRNQLVARVFDALNQPGPDSNVIEVFYEPSQGAGGIVNAGDDQLLLRSDYTVRSFNPGDDLNWTAEVLGGRPSYAVSWDWGDDTVEPVNVVSPGKFEAGHSYAKSGVYHIIIKATDAGGQKAYLQLVAIINGPLTTASSTMPLSSRLLMAWPIFLVLVLLIIAFWMGERYEDHRLEERGQLVRYGSK